MVFPEKVVAFLAITLCGLGALAHPGDSIELINREAALHKAALRTAHASMTKCENHPEALRLKEDAIARRSAYVKAVARRNGKQILFLDMDALKKWEAISHDHTKMLDWDASTPEDVIFGSNATTALSPESILGPYFVSGELFRKDITEGQKGVPLHLDIQFVNQNDCTAIKDMLVDVWQSNATGVYSGIAQGAGQTGLNTTFLRGVAKTDAQGVVQFDTVFPGHYGGRANHVHILTTEGYTLLPNNTYTGGSANHLGQLYFNQALNDEVEKQDPYNTNKQQYLTNQEDGFAKDAASNLYDPFMSYIRLGKGPADGILAYITVGIDQKASYDASPAARWGSDGGHECHNGQCN
ncbi:Intradiol ring-cleavage dioxygenase [Pestalotiopsis sp. NC0098]|nr:Intradiol ring-cleavage dioxygenase [Pestalotiopsis sp. NC0098]